MRKEKTPSVIKPGKSILACWSGILIILILLIYLINSSYTSAPEESPEETIPLLLLAGGATGAWLTTSFIYKILRSESRKRAIIFTTLAFPCLFINVLFIYAGCIFLAWL
ncbi:MAG: hypothetical protein ACJ76F_13935 [Bacteroidia bacterium]